MIKARWLVLLFAFGGLVLIGRATAHASCAFGGPPPTLTAQLATANVEFVGTVIYTSDGNRAARVRVESIWKGPRLPAYVDVHGEQPGSGPFSGSEGDHHYQAGERYLFMPLNDSSPFEDYGDCNSSTQPYSAALAAFAPPGATAPDPATPVDSVANFAGPYGWAVATGVLLVVAVSALLFKRRRTTNDEIR